MGKVIAAFAGTGKSYIGGKYPKAIDLDLGSFRWIYDGDESLPYEQRKAMRMFEQNPNFPQNYIDAIIKAKENFDLVFVSNAQEISHLIDYNFIPSSTAWDTLEQRYRARKNPERFIEIFKALFDMGFTDGIVIDDNEFLEQALIKEGLL